MIERILFGPEDQVGVFDSNFDQVFKDAIPMRADVTVESKLMKHPLESGSFTTDHKIDLPIKIELTLILSSDLYSDTYFKIFQLKKNSTILSVQTKSATYDNMVIKGIPHEEIPDMFGHIRLQLKLEQVIIVEAKYGAAPKVKPKNPNKNTTVDRGQIQPKQPSQEDADKGKSAFHLTGEAARRKRLGAN